MQLRLYNPAHAGGSISQHALNTFDSEGVCVCDNLEDIVMLVREFGCAIIDSIQGGTNVNELKVLEITRYLNRGSHGDEELLVELHQIRDKNLKPLIVKNGVAVFYN